MYERPCERVLEKDAANTAKYCAAWAAECSDANRGYYGRCEVVRRRCERPARKTAEPASDEPIDD